MRISAVARRNFPVSPRATTKDSKQAQATPTRGDDGQVKTSPLLAVANLKSKLKSASEIEEKVCVKRQITLKFYRTIAKITCILQHWNSLPYKKKMIKKIK